MEDYPRTLRELETRFSTQEACGAYLFALRWPDGFRCPKCRHEAAWPTSHSLYMCAKCGRQVSVTAGTIFHRTRTPLSVWFRAMWWVVTQKNGASALGLKRVLGLGSYETAWTWLHKFRRAMVRPGRDRLTGIVEVDEAFIGGLEAEVGGRKTFTKARVAIAAQEDGKGIGRIRMCRIKNTSAGCLHRFILESVELGSTIRTDGWDAYRGLDHRGYVHQRTSIRKSDKDAVELLPRVHRVISLVKRWILGTHQGAVAPEHIDYYLDEYTFRFNRRKSMNRGKLFFRLLQQAMQVEPAPYKDLIKRIRGPKRKTTANWGNLT